MIAKMKGLEGSNPPLSATQSLAFGILQRNETNPTRAGLMSY
jgi:hypothetical protein